jgi:Nucleotidyltransferase domain
MTIHTHASIYVPSSVGYALLPARPVNKRGLGLPRDGTRFETEAPLGGRPQAQEEGARAAEGAGPADYRPEELADYLDDLVERVRRLLGDELVGVYLMGSAALGGYVHGRSDVDVTVVVRAPLERSVKEAMVAALRHEALPCPARGLELVVYARGRPDPELNLNSGERMPFVATFAPGEDSPHWFVLDRAILAARGRVLSGPPPAEIFPVPSEEEILEALSLGLQWYRDRPEEPRDDAALNAVRARAYLERGEWISKAEAVERLLDEVSSSVESRRARLRGRAR